MGHVYVNTKLISPVTNEGVALEALVDTGATFTTIPLSLAEKLKPSHITRRKVRTASGEDGYIAKGWPHYLCLHFEPVLS